VSQVQIPVRVDAGQSFDVTWTVTNRGTGSTSDKTPRWDDLIYLSRDEFLDLNADLFLHSEIRDGVLRANESYTMSKTLKAPNLTGPFFVFVVTDPVRGSHKPRGQVHEGPFETNNARPSDDPLIIQQPPPSDLQVQEITIPVQAKSGDTLTIAWRTRNVGTNAAQGAWSDALYLSADAGHQRPRFGPRVSPALYHPARKHLDAKCPVARPRHHHHCARRHFQPGL
jgi:hypothetical protein